MTTFYLIICEYKVSPYVEFIFEGRITKSEEICIFKFDRY